MKNDTPAIEIKLFHLGPIDNNTYLLTDPATRDAIVIDPSFDIQPLTDHIRQFGLHVKSILITHAHFDHLAGVNSLLSAIPERPQLALHKADLPLWKNRGDALRYGFQLGSLPEPDHLLLDREVLTFPPFEIAIHHTPGHTPGHVVFHLPQADAIFVGDVIFAGSIGRTDLTGGNLDELLESIRKTIFSFPGETRLLPGHGPETTVDHERLHNPYLQ